MAKGVSSLLSIKRRVQGAARAMAGALRVKVRATPINLEARGTVLGKAWDPAISET